MPPAPPTRTPRQPPSHLPTLLLQSWNDFEGDGEAETYLLQWIYGNVAHAPTGALGWGRVGGCACMVMDPAWPLHPWERAGGVGQGTVHP